MQNLLEETEESLSAHNKTFDDIIAIQGNQFGMTIEKFIELADTEYDDGFGSQEVAEDLVIIGDNWWLERYEYDGAEQWVYKEIPAILPIREDIFALTVNQSGTRSCGWETLSELQEKMKETDEDITVWWEV